MKLKLISLKITSENRYELDNLDKYESLRSLHIKCGLTEIPVLKGLKNLKLLNLSCNKIRSLDGLKNLKNLKNLETLYLGVNLIKGFSGLKYLENLQNLTELSLSHNKINSLGALKNLKKLKNLEDLSLNSNLLKDLRGLENLSTLINLKELTLSYNNISTLDISCPIPPSLSYLGIDDNPISKVISLAGFKDHNQSCSIEHFRQDGFTDDNYKQFVQAVKDAELVIKKRTTDWYEDKGEYDIEIIDLWKPPPPSKEFKVNKYITLKLNYNDKTVIYINGEKFRQCRYLMIEISLDNFKSKRFKNINSIDDLEEDPDYSLEFSADESPIPADVEFWGHSSNLQAWYELDYDTRVLHRNLAFPLLKKLTEIGDKKARKVFKEEIARRYSSGNNTVKEFLKIEGYLDFLSKDELNSLKE